VGLSVFFSHNVQDKGLVDSLKAEAGQGDIQIYTFDEDVQAGQYVDKKIRDRISRSDAVVVLLSAQGLASPYVQQEIGVALALGKPIVPLVERGVEVQRLAMLQGREVIFFERENPAAVKPTLMGQLTRALSHKNKELLIGLGFVVVLILLIYLAGRKS